MFSDAFKKAITENQEYAKYNIFMMCGAFKLKKIDDALIISYHPLQSLFLIAMTIGFGPIIGICFLTGVLPLDDAPLFAKIIAVIVPLSMTTWLFFNLKSFLFHPTQVELNHKRHHVILHNPNTEHYYKGEHPLKWPKKLPTGSIAYCHLHTIKNSNNHTTYNFNLHPSTGSNAHIKLLATGNKKTAQVIANYVQKKLDITLKDEANITIKTDKM